MKKADSTPPKQTGKPAPPPLTPTQRYLLEKHALNVHHMQRRIMELNSPTQKKKQTWNPYYHPTVLWRTPEQIETMARSSPKKSPVKTPASPSSTLTIDPELISITPTRSTPTRSSSAPKDTSEPLKASGYEEFEQLIIQYILKHDSLKVKDIQSIFQQAVDCNPHLSKDRLDLILHNICKKLDLL
eukprot:TRINITY_DN3764_c0_g1_i1.p1 TRINITY_DN3764_c0_g1~~TRINITY_DN3764_c0_g1_i1.p1  ORF type:complete len:186 (+),score=29.92 TRINITY_DN3764_c0_g1_i1:349-906(+)